jgi:hypothetical protein
MKTSEALFKQYNKKFVPLLQISTEYLGISDASVISKMALKNDLGGIKAFRMGSTKSPWLVDIEQLADVLDSRSRS